MTAMRAFLAATGLVLVLAGGPVSAGSGRDPENAASRAQERLDRDLARAAERDAERNTRYLEERARIEERAATDPDKAAEDLAKLEEDIARDNQRAAEEVTEAQEDFEEEAAKEADDAAERTERGDDSFSRGSSEQIRDLGSSEGAEHDADGFPVRRGELVGVDVAPGTVTAAEARGFRVIGRERLETLGREILRLATPEGMSAPDARRVLMEIDPDATVDLVHYYGLSLTATGRGRRVRARSVAAAPPARAISVGVIDTAVAQHQGLGGARIVPWAAGNQAAAPVDHGTAVASLIAREGQATIYSANIFRGGTARPFTSADVIAEALEWQLAQGVQTINMSLAGPRNVILDRLIRDAIGGGRIVVAAAGNGGPTAPPAYPAAVPGVIAVTAVDGNLRIYRYANRGRYITVAARGVDVVAANAPAGGFARFSGTSFATPHIAGWLARCRAEGNNAATCTARLRSAARDIGEAGFDDIFGYGFIA